MFQDYQSSVTYPRMKKTDLPGPFKVKLPEIYQIEASSDCDHSCTMCPRAYYHRENKKDFFELDLLKTMIERGDLDGSYFIELQMSGEPLLNPEIPEMVDLIREQGMIVGLSTHGDLFPGKLKDCEHLDYITVSVDSIRDRNKVRKGSKDRTQEEYLKELFDIANFFIQKKIPIDFQFVELKGWKEEKEILENYFKSELKTFFDKINIRSIPDCCILHRSNRRLKKEEDKGVCLNPWLSVSVQSNGNVSSCCFAWGDENVYGNLYESSLEEIWNGEKVKKLREAHSRGFTHLPDLCMKCYTRSPALLHWELYLDSVVSFNRRNRLIKKLENTMK